jgi:hypothetical protein
MGAVATMVAGAAMVIADAAIQRRGALSEAVLEGADQSAETFAVAHPQAAVSEAARPAVASVVVHPQVAVPVAAHRVAASVVIQPVATSEAGPRGASLAVAAVTVAGTGKLQS